MREISEKKRLKLKLARTLAVAEARVESVPVEPRSRPPCPRDAASSGANAEFANGVRARVKSSFQELLL